MDHFYTHTWDFREHVRAHRAISRQVLGSWRLIGLALPGVLLVLLMLVALSSSDPSAAFAAGLPWLLLIGLWLAIFLFGLGWVAAWQTQRADPSVREPMHRAISGDGVKVITSTTTVDLKWNGINRVVETEEFFLFFFSRQCAYYLPKRAISDGEELRALRDTIREHFEGVSILRDGA